MEATMADWMPRSESPKGDANRAYEVSQAPDSDRIGRRDRGKRADLPHFLRARNVMVKSVSRSRSRGRPEAASEAPSTLGTLSTVLLGPPNLQERAHQQRGQDGSSLLPDVGGVDPEPRTLRDRASRPRPEYQETGDSRKVKLARFGLRAFFTVVGAVSGGAAGSLLGGLGGATVGSTFGPAGTIGGLTLGAVGGIVGGALVGGAAGWAIADRIIASWFGDPQDRHLRAAEQSLIDKRGEFTAGETANLAGVSKSAWRRLLHVPSSKGKYTPFEGSGRVRTPERRQKIREALVRHVAMTNSLQGADRLKQNLMAAAVADRKAAEQARKAGQRPPAVDGELNRAIAEDRVSRIYVSLGLGDGDVLDTVKAESRLAGNDGNRDDKMISRSLVEAAAARAADAGRVMPADRAKHTRAVAAIAAHAARYTRDADDFMTGNYPGAAALPKIFKKYDEGQGYQTNTLDLVRNAGALGAPSDETTTVMMRGLIGENNQREVVERLPPYWPRLLRTMADAAARHAPGDIAEDGERCARLAVLRGLTGTGLSARRGDKPHRAQRLEDNARRVEAIFGATRNEREGGSILPTVWRRSVDGFMTEIRNEAYDQRARDAALGYPHLRPVNSGQANESDLDLDQSSRDGDIVRSSQTMSSQTTQSSAGLESSQASESDSQGP
jgi:hypothetical protein